MDVKNIVIGLIILVVVAGGGWYYMNSKNTITPAPVTETPSVESQATPATESATTPAVKSMVTISSMGFEPKSITIKVGEEVTWTNSDTVTHTVNSDPHPTHGNYSILNTVGMIKAGESKSAMFDKAGTYTYHDHLYPSLTGTVIVQ